MLLKMGRKAGNPYLILDAGATATAVEGADFKGVAPPYLTASCQ